MLLFRLQRSIHGFELSGVGSAVAGGRWNSKGLELIYTSANRSLAMAEVAVHCSIAALPKDFYMLEINAPENEIEEMNQSALPIYWNQFPPLKETQLIGDEFVRKNSSLLLKVPSAVTKGDYNFLINPRHPKFNLVTLESKHKFPFDNRLFQ